MLVKNYMQTKVLTVQEDSTFEDVIQLMKRHKIRHVPVVREGKVVGFITESDVRRASASPASSLSVYELNYLLEKIKVRDIMTPEVVTASPDMTLEEAALIMRNHKFGGLPVVEEDGRLVGIITLTDIVDVFLDVMGVGDRGIRLTIDVADVPGQIFRLAKIINRYKVNIQSIVASHHPQPGMRRVVIRIQCADEGDEIVKAIESEGFEVESRLNCEE